MTVEEAISDLEQYAKQWLGGEAIDMAIRSLEAWEKVKEEITQVYFTKPITVRNEVLAIIDKHLKEVENADSD